MPNLEAILTVDKVTKNTVRYRELKETPIDEMLDTQIFPVIYIRKEALIQLIGKPYTGNPDTIKVTVEVV